MKALTRRTRRKIFLPVTVAVVAILFGWLLHHYAGQYERDRALYAAVEAGDVQAVRSLLNAGANANVREHPAPPPTTIRERIENMLGRLRATDTGPSALMMAAWGGNEEIVQLLLDAHADINVVNKQNGTALNHAALSGHNSVVSQLLKAGADPNLANAGGSSVLWAAVHSNCDGRAVRDLLAHGAKYRSTNLLGVDALITALHNNDPDVLAAFLDRGQSVESDDGNGTLLMQAAEAGNKPAVQLLLDRGAKIEGKGPGASALDRAEATKKMMIAARSTEEEMAGVNEVIALLRSRGR